MRSEYFRKYNKTLTRNWEQIGDIRNVIKEKVKATMGWAGDTAFYDRIYGRVPCTPAEQLAFSNAVAEVILKTCQDFANLNLFPAEDFAPVTIE